MPGGTGGVGRSGGRSGLEPGRDLKPREQGEAEAGHQGNTEEHSHPGPG